MREWHQKNKERRKPLIKARKQKEIEELKAYVKSVKESTPCADCGRSYPSYVMDFDHRNPGEKSAYLKRINRGLMSLVSRGRHIFLAELAKCDIVCANCHRERTEKQRLAGIW